MSPKDPPPIFLPRRNLFPTRRSICQDAARERNEEKVHCCCLFQNGGVYEAKKRTAQSVESETVQLSCARVYRTLGTLLEKINCETPTREQQQKFSRSQSCDKSIKERRNTKSEPQQKRLKSEKTFFSRDHLTQTVPFNHFVHTQQKHPYDNKTTKRSFS